MKTGCLDQLSDVQVTRVDRSVHGIIKSARAGTLASLQTSIDSLTLRVRACERRQGRTIEIQSMKAYIAGLCQDMDYLKSIDFNDLMRMTDDVHMTSKIFSTTTGYVLCTHGS